MRKVPKRITVRMLERMGACAEGVAEFTLLFGDSAAFVPGNIYRAVDGGLGTGAMEWLLYECGRADFVRLWNDWAHSLQPRPSWRSVAAAALCRLARQNIRRKQVPA